MLVLHREVWAWDEDKDVLSDWLESAPAVPSTVPRWPMEDHDRDTAAVTPEPMAHLVFHVLSDRTAVIVVTPEGTVHGHVATLGQEALTERVTAIRKALSVDNAPRSMEIIRDARRSQASEPQSNCESLLRSLYEELIRPVVDFLPDDGTPVVIEPHKALWLLPFAALQGTDGKWFADRCPIPYSPSAQVLEEIRKERDYGSSRDLKPLIVAILLCLRYQSKRA